MAATITATADQDDGNDEGYQRHDTPHGEAGDRACRKGLASTRAASGVGYRTCWGSGWDVGLASHEYAQVGVTESPYGSCLGGTSVVRTPDGGNDGRWDSVIGEVGGKYLP